MNEHLEGFVLAVITLTFVNSTALLIATIFLIATLKDLQTTCRNLRKFLVERFTATIDKL